MNRKSAETKDGFFSSDSGYPDLRYRIESYPGISTQEDMIRTISEEFGFSEEEDNGSAQLLESELRQNRFIYPPPQTLEKLKVLLKNRLVFVAGSGDTLDEDLKCLVGQEEEAHVLSHSTLMAVDGAVVGALKHGLAPHVVVSDLDGPMSLILECNRKGAVMIVLAHGDNKEAVREYIKQMGGYVLGTTQREAFSNIHNFGGFTDGDRAVILARHFQAKEIVLLGFDFGKPGRYSHHASLAKKKKKLGWCQRILRSVEGVVGFGEWIEKEGNTST